MGINGRFRERAAVGGSGRQVRGTARLVERHAISEDLARKLVAWRHPGFSSHIAEAIPFENKRPSRTSRATS
jgi:hypothetical protein